MELEWKYKKNKAYKEEVDTLRAGKTHCFYTFYKTMGLTYFLKFKAITD